MCRRLHKAITVITLSLVFSLGPGAPARSQMIEVGGTRGRRVGRVVLPTPPFNPDAGILDGPKSHGRDHTQAAPPGESLQTFLQ
jgi:hypothetical protein